MKIAMTGVSGNMGREALKQTLELGNVQFVRVLLSWRKRNNKLAKKLKKQYGDRIGIVRGSVADKNICKALVAGMNYVVHMAAVIPPRSDNDFEASEECNLTGTMALADAVFEEDPQPKFIHISTVALYGNRNEKHPFGRVGDPLIISPFDTYAMHKLKAERYVLERGIKTFAVLRQTAMLHPNMLNDNVSDGLMFHTCVNAPLEWVSSRDSGYLIKRILERDSAAEVPEFWCKIYNIGAGKKGMATGYDTFKYGFGLIGGSAEKFFRPEWLSRRNFHGLWYYDGNELEELFHYQRDGMESYWQEIGRRHKLFKLAKIVPKKLIDLFLFRRLLKTPNAPMYWKKSGDDARVYAYFGPDEVPTDWKDVKLIAKGDFGDYDEMREVKNAVLLDHGYDDRKPLSDWTRDDLESAAKFRGGECLSADPKDPYKAAKWRCHDGHEFTLSPFTVLKGGHWCPVCSCPAPWDFDRQAKFSPYLAQVWYDSHVKNEDMCYDLDGKTPIMRHIEEHE